MLFNSFAFIIFLISVFILYWLIPKDKIWMRNLFLVFVSYIFYGWWDIRFLILIFISSFVDFFVALRLAYLSKASHRKWLLITSLIFNLGILGTFKYYDFFVDSFNALISRFGVETNLQTLHIILPVGISFYTLQTLSYTIDVYKKKMSATKDIISFFAFVSFFPQLVAGPIERAAHLLPQFHIKKKFDTPLAKEGLRQIAWGLVQKIVIADNCAIFANNAFGNVASSYGYSLWLGVILFGFQIYGDFAGYSNIAIGTGKLFGFRMMKNFDLPYFATNINSFWNKWHISLSTWFRDYVYIPLGGNRVSIFLHYRNIIIVFLLSGLWHGANWTFVIWGALHAVFLILHVFISKRIKPATAHTFTFYIRQFLGWFFTFMMAMLSWVFFRADSLAEAIVYLQHTYQGIIQHPLEIFTSVFWYQYEPMIYVFIAFVTIEFLSRKRDFALQFKPHDFGYQYRWVIYLLIVTLTVMYGQFEKNEFIYFAF